MPLPKPTNPFTQRDHNMTEGELNAMCGKAFIYGLVIGSIATAVVTLLLAR